MRLFSPLRNENDWHFFVMSTTTTMMTMVMLLRQQHNISNVIAKQRMNQKKSIYEHTYIQFELNLCQKFRQPKKNENRYKKKNVTVEKIHGETELEGEEKSSDEKTDEFKINN